MRKSTGAISLTLIGSSLILSACVGCSDSYDGTNRGTARRSSGYGSSGYHRSWWGGSRPYSGSSTVGKGSSVSRGGFGSAGHSAGGS
ncbi:MAG TPA: hypothetical protein VKS79_26930 [Gemmataceae bacterium]|nr:hypothetical protein [Gemmataceae bacterium]